VAERRRYRKRKRWRRMLYFFGNFVRGLDVWICALAITLICSFSLAKRATAAQRSAQREKSAALEECPASGVT